MAVPPSDHPCWHQLAAGGLERLRTQHLGVQLMGKRMERANDPMAMRAAEIHAFFAKWERALPAEIAQLKDL